MSRHALAFRPWFAANPWAPAPSQLHDQHFGLGMHLDHLDHLDDLLQPNIPYYAPPTYERPWRHHMRAHSVGAMDKDGFKIVVDVQQFKPEEITVKQVEGSVVVEGKHEETEDEHGFVSRHFVRRYVLPQGIDHQALNSTLSSDGVLTITAPKAEKMQEGNMRTVKIQQTGKPAVKNAEKRG